MKKHFDICILNPPYGSTGGDTVHLKFVENCLDICNKQVVVMPFTFVTKLSNKVQNKYKDRLSKYITDIEEVNSNVFTDTAMPNVGIYVLDNNKDKNEKIKITYIKGNIEELNSLLDKKNTTDYEDEILHVLSKNGSQFGFSAGGHDHVTKKSLARQGITDSITVQQLINQDIEKNCIKAFKLNKLSDNDKKIYMIVNSHLTPCGKYFTKNVGQLYNSLQEIIKDQINRQKTAFFNYLVFNSEKEAENCKAALNNPLLRFALYKVQDDQNMTINKCYKYVPSIDWSDDRVKTDEGLLEVCGCPKDKIKEYVEYCKDIIKKVDNGERP